MGQWAGSSPVVFMPRDARGTGARGGMGSEKAREKDFSPFPFPSPLAITLALPCRARGATWRRLGKSQSMRSIFLCIILHVWNKFTGVVENFNRDSRCRSFSRSKLTKEWYSVSPVKWMEQWILHFLYLFNFFCGHWILDPATTTLNFLIFFKYPEETFCWLNCSLFRGFEEATQIIFINKEYL